MNKPIKKSELSRRQVMIGAAGLSFAFAIGRADAAVLAGERSGKALSPWVSIAPDGTITIMSAATEMGQGSMTSLPLILAEELDADWSKVRIVPAPPIDQIYGNPAFFGMMYTAGSNAVTGYFRPLRIMGAQVRLVLLDNAARKLGVPVEELTTEPSVVVHAKSGAQAELWRHCRLRRSAGQGARDQTGAAQENRRLPPHRQGCHAGRFAGQGQRHRELRNRYPAAGNAVRNGVAGSGRGLGSGQDRRGKGKGGAWCHRCHPASPRRGCGRRDRVGCVRRTPGALAVTWSRTGTAWGFDSDKGVEAFAADARNLSRPARDWSAQGNARAEFQKAASVLEAEYRCDYAYHAQMEPLNAVASVSASGDAAEIWAGTQSQTTAQEAPAKLLGISRDKVKLHDLLMGGGFGRRGNRDVDFIIDAVMLSKEIKRPVKVMWTREDDVRNGRFRPLSAHYLRAGFDAAGKLTAWHHRVAADRITPFMDPVRFQLGGGRDGMVMSGTDLRGYDVPHQLVEQLYRDTGIRTNPLRGIGNTANKFATESFMDEVARKRGLDPLAYRLDLLRNTPRALKVVERAAQMAEWGRKREGRALGLAYIDYSGTQLAGIAEVSLDRASGQIKVHNFWCTIDCGIAVQPDNVVAQTESSIVYGLGLTLSERISIRDGAVEQSNFYDYRLPRMNEVPAMHIELIRTENHPTGAGQMATPLLAPTIASAVFELTGVRLRHTPFTPERVKKALS